MAPAFDITSAIRKLAEMKTAYELLGIPRTATLREIECRYRFALNACMLRCGSRRLSKKERAQVSAMRDAYLLLTSPTRRRAYDQLLEQRARARSLAINIGGMALAVLALLAGIVLIGGAERFKQMYAERSVRSRMAASERAAAAPQNASASAGNRQAH